MAATVPWAPRVCVQGQGGVYVDAMDLKINKIKFKPSRKLTAMWKGIDECFHQPCFRPVPSVLPKDHLFQYLNTRHQVSSLLTGFRNLQVASATSIGCGFLSPYQQIAYMCACSLCVPPITADPEHFPPLVIPSGFSQQREEPGILGPFSR